MVLFFLGGAFGSGRTTSGVSEELSVVVFLPDDVDTILLFHVHVADVNNKSISVTC
jgi:hypothetical protein